MTDRGAHVIDIVQMFLGADGISPVYYSATGTREPNCFYDAFFDFEFTNVYPNGLEMIGSTKGPRGAKFIGSEGNLFVHIHGGKLEADPRSYPSSRRTRDHDWSQPRPSSQLFGLCAHAFATDRQS